MCDQRIGTVIVRRPGPRLCEGLVTFQEREAVSFDAALVQWETYVDTFRLHGWKVVEVDPADDCPDAVFIEVLWRSLFHSAVFRPTIVLQDVVVFFDSVAVVTRPGALSRRPETTAVEKLVRTMGYRFLPLFCPHACSMLSRMQISDMPSQPLLHT